MNKTVAISFSGGKDSCLALYELKRQGIDIACLLTTVWKESNKTVAHDEKLQRIEAQAQRFNIPVHFIETDFKAYQVDFVDTLKEVKKKFNLDSIAFGDIYLMGHREWGEQVAASVGLEALYPLWMPQAKVTNLLRQFVNLGFKAQVIKVDASKLPKSWEGRIVDETFIEDILQRNVCPMGESGEYHTYVYDGPLFD